MDPVEVVLARNKVSNHKSELEEAVQLSNVRGLQERLIYERLNGMADSVAGVDRAWRVLNERSRYELEASEAECSRLRGKLIAVEAENAHLNARVTGLQTTLQRLENDYKNAVKDGEDRVARVQENKLHEVSAWKEEFSAQMQSFVASKVSETRLAAVKEQQAVLDSTLSRVESEWRSRLEDSITAIQAAQKAEAAARQEADTLRRRLDHSDSRGAILEGEVSSLKNELTRCKAELLDHTAGGRQLAEEVMRLRSMLDLERSAHEQMSRLAEVKHKHESDSVVSHASHNMANLSESHRLEMDRLRRVYEVSIAAREEALAEWRAKCSSAEMRAEKAESLLREIDRQLVPAVASSTLASTVRAAAVDTLSGSNYFGSPSATQANGRSPSAGSGLGASYGRSSSRLGRAGMTPSGAPGSAQQPYSSSTRKSPLKL